MTLQDLFGDRILYEIPIYQRPMYGTRRTNGCPCGRPAELPSGSVEWAAVAHFLGAIVIELTCAEPGHVKQFSVIDGQQRLTTLQLVLAAIRAVIEHRDPAPDGDLGRLLRNEGRHAEGPLRFKIWPSERDRPVFRRR